MRTLVLAVAVVVLAGTATSEAQVRGMGRFAGTVVDDSGAPVEGVKVTARLDANGGVVEGATDDKGAWAVAGVGKGVWMVEFRKAGFTPRAAKVILERELDKVPAIKMELKKG
jgi:uncharacterized GH25 family protein